MQNKLMLVSALSVILALMMPEATGMKQHSSYSRTKKEKNYCRTQVKKSFEADNKKNEENEKLWAMLDNVPPADWSLVENTELNISDIGIENYKVFDDGPADWGLGPDAESKLFDLNMNENEEKERQYDFSLADFYLDIEKS